jgi:hypothetical protein
MRAARKVSAAAASLQVPLYEGCSVMASGRACSGCARPAKSDVAAAGGNLCLRKLSSFNSYLRVRSQSAGSQLVYPCYHDHTMSPDVERPIVLKQSNGTLLLRVFFTIFTTSAYADDVKQLNIEKGKASIVFNLVSPRPDCSNDPAPQPLPMLSEKPLHGTIGVQLGSTNVAATGNCPDRKIPSFALFYLPQPDFLGEDSFQIEIDNNNKQTKIAFQITVQVPELKQ